MLSPEAREDLIKRMRKVEGQTQGIQRMLAEGRDPDEVLNQLASVRAATRRVSLELMRYYALERLSDQPSSDGKEAVHDIIDLLLKSKT